MSSQSQIFNVEQGHISYTLSGPPQGRLVVLAHGVADSARAFRFLVPKLNAAGYQTANVDIRGCGESSTNFSSYSRTDIANDLIALIKHINPRQPVAIVGHSISGGAATIAAALEPTLIAGLVELAPFTKEQSMGVTDFFRKGVGRLLGAILMGSPYLWGTYLEAAMPGDKRPEDWQEEKARINEKLRQNGRMSVLKQMCLKPPTDADKSLSKVQCPVLIIMGDQDCDWASPSEEGEAILAKLTQGLGRVEIIEETGHYPHFQYPEETWARIEPFLKQVL